MTEQTIEGDYAPHVEWANVSYSFTPDLRIRAGRIVAPPFMVSDSRKVSYATTWVRPPVELYGMVPIYFLDGVDGTYRRRLGEWTGTLGVAIGQTSSEFSDGEFIARDVWNANTVLARGPLSLRMAAAGTRLYIPQTEALFDGFRAFGPQGESIAQQYDVNGKRTLFAAAGFEYDPGKWFAMAEVGWTDSRSAFGEKLGGQITTGLRWRAFTPYATYARTDLVSDKSTAGLTLTSLPPEYAQAAAQLNAGLNALMSAPAAQQTLSFGSRWDLIPGLALKAQLDFVDLLGASSGTFINAQPGFERGGSARLFSVATAFVF
jgi:hypothetical protein